MTLLSDVIAISLPASTCTSKAGIISLYTIIERIRTGHQLATPDRIVMDDITEASVWPTLLGSATSGLMARIPCHPLDTVKARLQADLRLVTSSSSTKPITGLISTMRSIAQTEGIRGLYRGCGVTFLGSGPGTMLYFTSYELSRDSVMGALGLPTWLEPASHLAAGFMAEAVSCVFWVPIDVIKERMQVQGARISKEAHSKGGLYYHDTKDALRQISRSEGLAGLYRGYWATLASFGPFSALYFGTYEFMKADALRRTTKGREFRPEGAVDVLPFGWQVVTACAAGAFASFVTNPLDMVKLRLQVDRATAAHVATDAGRQAAGNSLSYGYNGLMDGLRSVVRQEGWYALFRGAGARMAFHAPSTAISMTAFEQCKAFYARLLR